jgi:hypothetical protein
MLGINGSHLDSTSKRWTHQARPRTVPLLATGAKPFRCTRLAASCSTDSQVSRRPASSLRALECASKWHVNTLIRAIPCPFGQSTWDDSYRDGRLFVNATGHSGSDYNERRYLEILPCSIAWVMGLERKGCPAMAAMRSVLFG